MRIRPLPAIFTASALALLTACASGGSPPPTGAEGEALFAAFSTTWALNLDESDTFQQALEEAQGATAPGAAAGGRGGGRGGRRGGAGGGFTDATREGLRSNMLGVQELGGMASSRLALAVSATSIQVRPDGGIGLDLVPHEPMTRTIGDLQLSITARWDGREFSVERQVQEGATLTETYRVSDSGDRLYVERVIRTRGGPIIRQTQVFDRAG
mgnify:CR=1 FL=1